MFIASQTVMPHGQQKHVRQQPCMYMYVCAYACARMHACTHTHTHTRTHAHIYSRACIHTYIHVSRLHTKNKSDQWHNDYKCTCAYVCELMSTYVFLSTLVDVEANQV